ncbi:hypothetical protein Pelo_14620 [Pelomyxa schiedti]|nr:hypothetical protein Pelo_14620 [Pelomyxa schiedti]
MTGPVEAPCLCVEATRDPRFVGCINDPILLTLHRDAADRDLHLSPSHSSPPSPPSASTSVHAPSTILECGGESVSASEVLPSRGACHTSQSDRSSCCPNWAHQLILRVGNALPQWRGVKTRNEVAAVSFIRARADPSVLPVPRVLAYSFDGSDDSRLNRREFILYSRMRGRNMGSVWGDLDTQQRMVCARNVAKAIVELRRVTPTFSMGGCFSDWSSVTSSTSSVKPNNSHWVSDDCTCSHCGFGLQASGSLLESIPATLPRVGPFVDTGHPAVDNFADYYAHTLRYYQREPVRG